MYVHVTFYFFSPSHPHDSVDDWTLETREPTRPPGSVGRPAVPGGTFHGSSMAGPLKGKREMYVHVTSYFFPLLTRHDSVDDWTLERREPTRPPGSIGRPAVPGGTFHGSSMVGPLKGKREWIVLEELD